LLNRLEGHTDVAAYALDWHPQEPIVASGGRDKQILLWNVDKYFNSHGRIPEEDKETPFDSGIEESQQLSRIQKSL
jgi:WD40 repeat protein